MKKLISSIFLMQFCSTPFAANVQYLDCSNFAFTETAGMQAVESLKMQGIKKLPEVANTIYKLAHDKSGKTNLFKSEKFIFDCTQFGTDPDTENTKGSSYYVITKKREGITLQERLNEKDMLIVSYADGVIGINNALKGNITCVKVNYKMHGEFSKNIGYMTNQVINNASFYIPVKFCN